MSTNPEAMAAEINDLNTMLDRAERDRDGLLHEVERLESEVHLTREAIRELTPEELSDKEMIVCAERLVQMLTTQMTKQSETIKALDLRQEKRPRVRVGDCFKSLAREVERCIEHWLNFHSIDSAVNKPDWLLAKDAMDHRTTERSFSIRQLLEIEDWGKVERAAERCALSLRLTEEDIRRLEDLANTDGPLDWAPVGCEELRQLLSMWRGQREMQDGAKPK